MPRATFWVQIEPEWDSYRRDSDGEPLLHGIKAKRITQNRPEVPLGGTVSMKLTVEVPEGVFKPLRPEAVIVVPEGMVVQHPIEVTVEDPSVD